MRPGRGRRKAREAEQAVSRNQPPRPGAPRQQSQGGARMPARTPEAARSGITSGRRAQKARAAARRPAYACPASGAAPEGAEGTAGREDHGLFGPGSVTWQIMGEPVMWVAGVRALYLQALHPRTMRAVWQNGVFTDPDQAWGRFLRTSRFVQTRHYGSLAEVEEAGRRVRKIHASLTGTDPDGTTFRLDEPDLLLWVHCGEIGSYVDVARRSGMGVSARELDMFVDEQRRSAAVVGLDPAGVPGSVAELDAYFTAIRPKLYACEEAKRALLMTYSPAALPADLLKLAVPPINVLGFAALPRWARRMYGLPGSPLTDMAATAALRAARRATTGVPGRLLYEPAARRVFGGAARAA